MAIGMEHLTLATGVPIPLTQDALKKIHKCSSLWRQVKYATQSSADLFQPVENEPVAL